MSRADRERALYVYKLSRIKDNLIRSYPELVDNKEIVNKINQRIKEELENVNEDSSECEESLNETESSGDTSLNHKTPLQLTA